MNRGTMQEVWSGECGASRWEQGSQQHGLTDVCVGSRGSRRGRWPAGAEALEPAAQGGGGLLHTCAGNMCMTPGACMHARGCIDDADGDSCMHDAR